MKASDALATIDLGTNAVRFDVFDISSRSVVRRVHKERWPVRLGEGVFETGRLSLAAMSRTVDAFRHFADHIKNNNIPALVSYGTSALRTASNSRVFITELERETGQTVEVISGAKEARLIAEAVLRWEPHARRHEVLLDIGGGSVEITLGRKNRVIFSVSMDLGVSRLQQMFLDDLPPRRSPKTHRLPIGELRRHLRRVLWAAAPRGGWPGTEAIVVSGGTARSIVKLESGEKKSAITTRQLSDLYWTLLPLSRTALKALPGMDPRRADIALVGTVLLEEIAQVFDAGRFLPTAVGLREGMVLEFLRTRGRDAAASKIIL